MNFKLKPLVMLFALFFCRDAFGQSSTGTQKSETSVLGPYLYEAKPDDPAFAMFNPRKAPVINGRLLSEGDRLAICVLKAKVRRSNFAKLRFESCLRHSGLSWVL